MLKSKKWAFVTGVMLVSFVLSACQGPTTIEVPVTVPAVVQTQLVVQTQVVEEIVRETQIVEVVATAEPPAPVDRNGAWLDTVVVVEEPSADAAVSRLEVGDIDLYAFQVTNAAVRDRVDASAALARENSFGSYSELSFNPIGVGDNSAEFPDGKLNPFAIPAVREAMNWLMDREYIAQELHGGMARPRWTAFNGASNDAAAMADVIRAIEFQYAYDIEKARTAIATEMEALGATMDGGVWSYNGEPVVITLLIRTEDERRDIGDYTANQLEEIGFTTVRDYKTAGEASPIWINGDPALGLFHIYTGGWITTQVPRDLGTNFSFFYTNVGLGSPLWQAYVNTPEFFEVADKLNNNDFTTLEERRELITEALNLAMKDSHRIWLIDRASITPKRAEVTVASDLYGSVAGSRLWPYTLRRIGEVGGSMRIGMPSILTAPWNPLNGTNWIYDAMLYRGIGEQAIIPDPFTGLNYPSRLERAEVVVETGLPVGVTLDWVDLSFEDSIAVPEDAWADWDAETQTFIPVGAGVTALSKNTVYYEADLFETTKWHDGSPISVGDFVMAMILTFDRAKETSPYYDPATVSALTSFLSAFKGVRIVSEDPLVIETYTDAYQLDAEQNVNTWFPMYNFGSGAWHNLTLGLMSEAASLTAFSSAKATTLEVDQVSYIAGPTIAILAEQLTAATADSFLPYAPTLGEYVDADEITSRYTNLAEWYRIRGHFWLGTGPFYLERAFPVEGTVILQRNQAYPDSADRWDRFSAPAIAEVELDGPTRVTIGAEATYDVFVEFDGEPYAAADIAEVKYLVFDAEGQLATVDVAENVEDGVWQFTLPASVTNELAAGSNRLEVVVVSRRVALPSTASLLFVTAP